MDAHRLSRRQRVKWSNVRWFHIVANQSVEWTISSFLSFCRIGLSTRISTIERRKQIAWGGDHLPICRVFSFTSNIWILGENQSTIRMCTVEKCNYLSFLSFRMIDWVIDGSRPFSVSRSRSADRRHRKCQRLIHSQTPNCDQPWSIWQIKHRCFALSRFH